MAVLPDGRMVSVGGGLGGRVLVWDPDEPQRGPVELGHYDGWVKAVAVLPDGRVITGGDGVGRVLVWDPDEPQRGPVELGSGSVGAVAVLPDGRVITGGGRARRPGAGVGPGRAGDRPGRARPPRRRGDGGGGAAGRAGDHRRRRSGAGMGYAKQLTRQSARMLRVRARYLPLAT